MDRLQGKAVSESSLFESKPLGKSKTPFAEFVEEWNRRHGRNPAWGKAEFGAIQTGIKRVGAEQALDLWKSFLSRTDEWLVDHNPKTWLSRLDLWYRPKAQRKGFVAKIEEWRWNRIGPLSGWLLRSGFVPKFHPDGTRLATAVLSSFEMVPEWDQEPKPAETWEPAPEIVARCPKKRP